MCFGHLELQLHGGDGLAGRGLGEFLDMGVQVARRHLRVAAGGRLQKRLVDEDVLILGLNHVVPLGAHARHMAVNVHCLLVLHAFQHGINHNEAASPAHARADRERQGRVNNSVLLCLHHYNVVKELLKSIPEMHPHAQIILPDNVLQT